jgi:SpoVK/Ycf46/Vps4 family AAA+-type ATPase
MLELSYNSAAKTYEAPLQLKANNGIYLVDDFGRQRATPADVLNRWVVPMETRIDYLSLRTGGKMAVPFEVLLVFATNLKPEQLGDEAFLRRLQYKMLVQNPDAEEFSEIFRRFCADRKLPCADPLIDRFIDKHYRRAGRPFRRSHPRDVLTHAISFIQFAGQPYELTEEILDQAFDSCFPVDDLDG